MGRARLLILLKIWTTAARAEPHRSLSAAGSQPVQRTLPGGVFFRLIGQSPDTSERGLGNLPSARPDVTFLTVGFYITGPADPSGVGRPLTPSVNFCRHPPPSAYKSVKWGVIRPSLRL